MNDTRFFWGRSHHCGSLENENVLHCCIVCIAQQNMFTPKEWIIRMPKPHQAVTEIGKKRGMKQTNQWEKIYKKRIHTWALHFDFQVFFVWKKDISQLHSRNCKTNDFCGVESRSYHRRLACSSSCLIFEWDSFHGNPSQPLCLYRTFNNIYTSIHFLPWVHVTVSSRQSRNVSLSFFLSQAGFSSVAFPDQIICTLLSSVFCLWFTSGLTSPENLFFVFFFFTQTCPEYQIKVWQTRDIFPKPHFTFYSKWCLFYGLMEILLFASNVSDGILNKHLFTLNIQSYKKVSCFNRKSFHDSQSKWEVISICTHNWLLQRHFTSKEGLLNPFPRKKYPDFSECKVFIQCERSYKKKLFR